MQNKRNNELNLDILFLDIARFVVETQNASISAIQREFGIPYARAGRIVDQLEIVGIIQGDPKVVLIKNQSDLKFHLEFQGLSIGVQSKKEEASKPDLNFEMTGTTPMLILKGSYVGNLIYNNLYTSAFLFTQLISWSILYTWIRDKAISGYEITDSTIDNGVIIYFITSLFVFFILLTILDKSKRNYPLYIYWSGSTFEAVLRDNSVNKYFDCTKVKIHGNKAEHPGWFFSMKVQHPLLCARLEELNTIHKHTVSNIFNI